MNMSNFAIWLKCFWVVVSPNWWTLALLVLAAAAFGVMKLVYGRSPVNEKGAMQQVGRRWQLVGGIVLAAALAVYVVEMLFVNLATVDPLANRANLKKDDFAKVLCKLEYDFAKYCSRNSHLMKDHSDIEAIKEQFAVKSQMSYADKMKVEFARIFSKYLAPTGNRRFYPAPDYTPDSQLKRDTVDKLIKHLDLAPDNDHYKTLTTTARDVFTAAENREALERLKALLNSEFSKDLLAVDYQSGAGNWAELKRETKDSVRNNTVKLRNAMIVENAERVKRIFDSPINPEIRSSATFEDYLAKIHVDINAHMENEVADLLSTDNFWEIRKRIISDLDSDPAFKRKNIKEQLTQFNSMLHDELGRQWQTRMDGIINRILEKWETEALLYNDDQLSYQQLRQDQKSFNRNLVLLCDVSPYLHDLFWLAVLAILALAIFWFPGAKIVRMGKPSVVKNKIHNA